jgi:hypothetical protein
MIANGTIASKKKRSGSSPRFCRPHRGLTGCFLCLSGNAIIQFRILLKNCGKNGNSVRDFYLLYRSSWISPLSTVVFHPNYGVGSCWKIRICERRTGQCYVSYVFDWLKEWRGQLNHW